jgi:predicted nucleotidyltransferase
MPTALELTRKGWRHYIEAASRRPALPELTPEEKRERKQLLAKIQEVATMLKSRFAVRRVVLFGSLAHTSWFTPGSDVDLAVEGLDTKGYWQAWRLAEEIIGDHPVDFIEIETAMESLKQAIQRYGVEL